MKIGILARYCERANKTGIEQYAFELCRRLLESRNDFVLFVTRRIEEEPFASRQQVILRGNLAMQLAYELPHKLRANGSEIFFNPGQYGYLGGGARLVFTAHDVAWKRYPTYFPLQTRVSLEALMRHASKKAAKIIAVSRATGNDLVAYYGCDPVKVVYIPHGYDSRAYRPEPRPDDARVLEHYGLTRGYILFLGTLQKRKNVIRLVEAYDRSSLSEIPLVLAGGPGWFYREIASAIENARNRSRIIVTGFVPEDHKPALYRNAGVFVYPSLYEGFGMPLLEAMACGTQIVGSRVSSMPEVMGDAGFQVDPNSVEEISAAIRQALERPRDVSILRSQASRFSWERTARETLAVFERLM